MKPFDIIRALFIFLSSFAGLLVGAWIYTLKQ